MNDGGLFRQLLDNFTLVYLFTAFVVIVVIVIFGSKKRSRDAAMSIFRNTDKPAPDDGDTVTERREESRK